MTAIHVIRQLDKLPPRERRKVFAYVEAAIERREDEIDRQELAQAKCDPRPAVGWTKVKAKHGLK